MTTRARNFVFTYILTEDETESYQNNSIALSEFVGVHDKLRCAIWQLESCPETRRYHLQGYVEYTAPMRVGGVKGHFGGPRLHLECRRGSRDQAIAYCRKSDSQLDGPWTIGDLGTLNPGKRNDLRDASDSIFSGSSILDLANERSDLVVRYHRGFQYLMSIRDRQSAMEFRQVSVLVYCGDAGTGKTRAAYDSFRGDIFGLDQGERLWFDGYSNESCLLLDDFYGWIKYGTLLKILDGYPYRADIKGGFTWGQWTTVIITSNKIPSQWYHDGLTAALRRRITRVERFDVRNDGTITRTELSEGHW